MSILAIEPNACRERSAPNEFHALPMEDVEPNVIKVNPAQHRWAPEPDVVKRIGRSIAYMREHLEEPLQVCKLAALAHSSQSHYFALFKRCTKLSPIDYFIRLRMLRAAELLESSAACVKEIAGVLGYDDPFYFSRVFKSVHGVAPTEYRRQSQSGATDPVQSEVLALNSAPLGPSTHAGRVAAEVQNQTGTVRNLSVAHV